MTESANFLQESVVQTSSWRRDTPPDDQPPTKGGGRAGLARLFKSLTVDAISLMLLSKEQEQEQVHTGTLKVIDGRSYHAAKDGCGCYQCDLVDHVGDVLERPWLPMASGRTS